MEPARTPFLFRDILVDKPTAGDRAGHKGTASLLVPLSSILVTSSGSWETVFTVAAVMNAVAALMAWFVLRPMRRTFIEQARQQGASLDAAKDAKSYAGGTA